MMIVVLLLPVMTCYYLQMMALVMMMVLQLAGLVQWMMVAMMVGPLIVISDRYYLTWIADEMIMVMVMTMITSVLVLPAIPLDHALMTMVLVMAQQQVHYYQQRQQLLVLWLVYSPPRDSLWVSRDYHNIPVADAPYPFVPPILL